MASPTHVHRPVSLLHDEPYTPRGSLASLMRRRSSSNLYAYGRDEEEAAGGVLTPSGMMTPGGSFLGRRDTFSDEEDARRAHDERRLSAILNNPQMRSMRLIGKAKRYRWERYWKTAEQLCTMTKPLREYYERNNMLIQQYLYIDRLLNSSLPHDLLNEYNELHSAASRNVAVPATIREESSSVSPSNAGFAQLQEREAARLGVTGASPSTQAAVKKVTRTPKGIYRPAETTPLLEAHEEDDEDDHDPDSDEEFRSRTRSRAATEGTATSNGSSSVSLAGNYLSAPYGATASDSANQASARAKASCVDTGGPGSKSPTLADIPLLLEDDENVDSSAPIVTLAIYINLAANAILLAGKTAVVVSVPSISVLASLVDAVLDFLSTAIVWTTTWMISNQDQYRYPVGRRRLEPLGVLVFSAIMITSFVQVMLEAVQRLASEDREIIELGLPAIIIMASTVVIKGLCWLWCRLVKNSSVQALASDAMTDVIFNAGSIAFPIVGFYARIWWLDALGGLLLSMVVIYNWSRTSIEHIKHLSGFSATADQRNILLYLTMRFAKTIKAIQGLQAYHGGDKLIVEVDIVLDANMSLKDSHDLSESLQYVIESVPIVDRAFVHADYADYNLPTHMEQQAE
ncbi:cation diffusion facilitator [Sporothrix brasiliensis 5110]|uniref:Cation diffusion facilitator n=1 Tax=Sporothrix brasiliensis 5110 TaxID=1398154 RepID=A0A0C2IUE6_9PEZI|nr:cation diffusion facilitator [Sporothrix brasiliensis 5110]KIH92751.1 cation diffusion facilitator [Sporothrix brasiliensis 5110]